MFAVVGHARRARRRSNQRRNGFVINRKRILKISNRDIQVPQEPVLQSVNPTVHRQVLTPFPRIAGNRRLANIDHLLDHVQLAKTIGRLRITHALQIPFMFLSHILYVTQPIVAQSKSNIPKRSLHAAATIMAANNDVLHLQDIDRELHHRQTIEIRVHDQIGDIPVDE